ncbi:hydrolase [Deltaproteobacteria bacterium Smac51]|nr:hydrolase [Deltaproteobacteria bacterium Smac51]UQZ91274.1 hydrolase [Deltaproteobacteria bacterium Smac51]
MKRFSLTFTALFCAVFILSAGAALAQASGKPYVRMDKDKAALLMVDHQTGLFSLVQDFEPAEFKNNVLALAALGKFFNLPTILSTSLEEGPNGPLLPEIRAMFPNAPVIHRPGQINAWDNEDFVEAVKKTGRSQVIIAGIVTDVCVAHVALSAVEAGFDVFVVVDASGTFNTAVRDSSWARMAAGGVQLVNWFSVACELHRDWRNDMEGLANILATYMPAYSNLITSQNFTVSNQKDKK